MTENKNKQIIEICRNIERQAKIAALDRRVQVRVAAYRKLIKNFSLVVAELYRADKSLENIVAAGNEMTEIIRKQRIKIYELNQKGD